MSSLFHVFAGIPAQLVRIENKIDQLLKQGAQTTMTLAQLQAQVTQNTTIEESAVTLINGIAAQLKAAASDPATIQALADQLAKSSSDLAAAITANTPAAPPTAGA